MLKNIQRGSPNASLTQSVDEGSVVDKRSAANVNQVCIRLHGCKPLGIHQAARGRGQRSCKHHVIGLCQHLVEEASLVDEVVGYIAPKLLGAGPPALATAGIVTIAEALDLELIDVKQVGPDLRIIALPKGR